MADEIVGEKETCQLDNNGKFAGDAVANEIVNKKSYNFQTEFSTEMDTQTLKLKMSLEAWKEIILPLQSVLQWEKQWHPLSIIGTSTIFFMLLWLLDPSILTTFALIGLTITLSDYIVPTLTCSLLNFEPWTEKKEDVFHKICLGLVLYKEKFFISIKSFYLLRTNKPKLFYGLNVITLLLLAWIGNNVNNLFLTYLVLTSITLLPGLEHHGLLQKYGGMIFDKIADMASSAKINVHDVKKMK